MKINFEQAMSWKPDDLKELSDIELADVGYDRFCTWILKYRLYLGVDLKEENVIEIANAVRDEILIIGGKS